MNFRCCGYHHYGEYLDYIKLLVAAVTQTAQRPFCSAPAAAGRRRLRARLAFSVQHARSLPPKICLPPPRGRETRFARPAEDGDAASAPGFQPGHGRDAAAQNSLPFI